MKRSNLVNFVKTLHVQSHKDGIGDVALAADTNRAIRYSTACAFAAMVAVGDKATGGDVYAAFKEAGIELEPDTVKMLDAFRALALDTATPGTIDAEPASPPAPPTPPPAPAFTPDTSGWGAA